MSVTGIAAAEPAAPSADRPLARRRVTVLFGATILLSSALLFLVEPMIAKMLLPSLGGVSAVWNTSLVFFQLLLLAGYAWAHVASRHLGLLPLVLVQGALFGLALVALPIAVPAMWQPDTTLPIRSTLAALAVAVGLPFLALATVSPMLQRWYSQTIQRHAGDPYFLYSASNAGSLLGLAGYPLVFEPSFALPEQARVWGALFVLLALLILACGTATLRLRRLRGATGAPPGLGAAGRTLADSPPAHHAGERLRWIALAAIPSALLLGVTHHFTTDIASFPLIWVVPLALYLATFMVAFGRSPAWLPLAAGFTLKLLVIPLALTLFDFLPIGADLALGLIVFTAAALVAHGELAATRPQVDRLTEFYLCVSIGGAVGGTLTALLAPMVLPVVLEYPLAVAAALLVLPAGVFSDDDVMSVRSRLAIVGVIAVVSLSASAAATNRSAVVMALAATLGVGVFVTARRPTRFAGGMALVLLLAPAWSALGAIHVDRSFFGTISIHEVGGFRELKSGSTVHGSQALDPTAARIPTTYYHHHGPVGDLFALRPDASPHAVAVVGLGVGTLASYGRPGDRYLFLEIDPLVARVAADPRYFTYLRDSPAEVEIRMGDGRLGLAASDERFDLVILDAFTSDAIPIHLMTLEAMAIYRDRLSEGGVLAYHVSNRYAELRPVLARQAHELGLEIVALEDGVSPHDAVSGKWGSTWVAVGRSRARLDRLGERWARVDAGDAPLWTDGYSNLVQVLELW